MEVMVFVVLDFEEVDCFYFCIDLELLVSEQLCGL